MKRFNEAMRELKNHEVAAVYSALLYCNYITGQEKTEFIRRYGQDTYDWLQLLADQIKEG